jgi:hypothetical protein
VTPSKGSLLLVGNPPPRTEEFVERIDIAREGLLIELAIGVGVEEAGNEGEVGEEAADVEETGGGGAFLRLLLLMDSC